MPIYQMKTTRLVASRYERSSIVTDCQTTMLGITGTFPPPPRYYYYFNIRNDIKLAIVYIQVMVFGGMCEGETSRQKCLRPTSMA